MMRDRKVDTIRTTVAEKRVGVRGRSIRSGARQRDRGGGG